MHWERALTIHDEAAAALAAAVEQLDDTAWLAPRAEGKWSPAEIVEHLSLAYDVLTRELGGGEGMRIRTKLWQRLLLRLTIVPKLLRDGKFPASARAPREIRPAAPNPDRRAALASFLDRAARFREKVVEVQRENRKAKLTHAYFGPANIADSVLLCARHVEHHAAQLG